MLIRHSHEIALGYPETISRCIVAILAHFVPPSVPFSSTCFCNLWLPKARLWRGHLALGVTPFFVGEGMTTKTHTERKSRGALQNTKPRERLGLIGANSIFLFVPRLNALSLQETHLHQNNNVPSPPVNLLATQLHCPPLPLHYGCVGCMY